jgi:phage gp36-like protein
MAYCTLTDIKDMMDEDEIIRFTDDADAGVVNTSVTDKAIKGADALIDSHIASRYSVPVSPVPDIIAELACDIAIYKICSRRSQAPEEIRLKYDDAVKHLGKIAAGKVLIPAATSASESASDDAVIITSGTRKFSRDSMDGF